MKLYVSLTIAAALCTSAVQSSSAEIQLFDRLAGTWDVTYEIHAKDGAIRPYHGQVIYTRILNGAALQEVWTSDIHNEIPQPYATTLGFYDAKRERWTAVSVFPAAGSTSIVSGGDVDGRIILEGRDANGTLQRWSIQEIKPDSFQYRFDSSQDDGKTWQLLGFNYMHRHVG